MHGCYFEERTRVTRKRRIREAEDEVEIEKANHNSLSSEKKQNQAGLSDTMEQMKDHDEVTKEEKVKNEEVRVYQAPVPFPQRLQQSKLDNQYAKFLNIFKNLEINIPFAEALAQMPHYAKFMKDISKKRKLDEGGVVSFSANYSAIIQKNMPQKMKDPGSFTIPCTIDNYEF